MQSSGRRHGGEIKLAGLSKQFGDFVALAGIDLEIHAGEFFSLLGPSGCGKTTTLRLIAGFEEPTSGAIYLDGIDLARTAAHKRPVNTVFQSYALFPHLTVEQNVAYGLRWRDGDSKSEKARRVSAAISLVQLDGFESRKPSQLSGGQQQRVALARALVLEPAVLLLDEPLGALDAKLRKTLQVELHNLQREVGITFVYVTHDQEEALTMSDRMAVMDRGHVAQVGTPRDVYEAPNNAYVADFLGVANLLDVHVDGDGAVALGNGTLRVDTPLRGAAKIVVRPERVRLSKYGSAGANRLSGLVDRLVYLGATTQVVVRLADGSSLQALVTNVDGASDYTPGTAVTVEIASDAVRVLPLADSLIDLTSADADRVVEPA